MKTTIEKLKAVVEVLEDLAPLGNSEIFGDDVGKAIAQRALPGLRSVIAEMEKAKPVGHAYTIAGIQHITITEPIEDGPLYADLRPLVDAGKIEGENKP